MSTTIEQSAPLLNSAARLQPRQSVKLVAQWQSGLQTFGGYEQRKLRLVLARLPLDARPTCPTPNKSDKERTYMLWTVLAVLAFTLAACKKAASPPLVVRPVRSIEIEKRQLGDPVVVSGNLRARDEVNLAFRISGRLIERKLGVGDMVQAGQTVALLDSEVERNSRNSAMADVAAARASLDQSEANERRQRALLTNKVIAPNEYEVALRQLKTTQAQLDAVQAKLKSAEEQLSYTELKSDAAGVITQTGPVVGEVVPAGQMVLKVAQKGGRDAEFNVPSQAIRDGLLLGQEGEVWLADHPEIKVDGKLREISPQADPVTRNYQIKVELANPPAEMLLGATVLGRLKLKGESLIEIPSSALTMIDDKPAVWVVDAKDQHTRRRKIVIARHAPDSVIVTGGLESGERVVTAGVQELHEGQAVKLLGGQ
jgi:RND family efflux transporter MFP subunit